VEMSAEPEEDAAIKELDGAEWMGRSMRVNKARPRNESRNENREGQSSRNYTYNSF